jgi:hypothetical protein
MPVFGYVSLRVVGRVPINTPVIIKADINVRCSRHQHSHHHFLIITSMSAVNAITAVMPAVTTAFLIISNDELNSSSRFCPSLSLFWQWVGMPY